MGICYEKGEMKEIKHKKSHFLQILKVSNLNSEAAVAIDKSQVITDKRLKDLSEGLKRLNSLQSISLSFPV